MPTINIHGQNNPTNGKGAAPGNVRGAAWDAYQAAMLASQATDSRKAADVDAAYAAKRVAAEKQTMAMWSTRNRQEQAARKSEAQLLREELRAADHVARVRARADADARRAQSIRDRAERSAEKRTRAEAEYENRDLDRRTQKQKGAAAAAYDAARYAAESENRARDRVYRPVAAGIASVGHRGAAAIREHDPVRALGARIRLGLMERTAARGVAAGGPQAGLYQRMAASVAEAREAMAGEEIATGLGSAGLGRALGWAYVAAKAGQMAWRAPRAMNDAEHGFIADARPYTSLLRGAADIGGAGGFDAGVGDDGVTPMSDSYADALTRSSWRRRFTGMSASDDLETVSAYGIAPRSAKEADAIAREAGAASMAPGLQGMSPQQLAGAAGRFESLAGPAGGSRMDFFRQFGKSMQGAITIGMDRTKMAAVIERVQGITAGAGGAVNMASAADYVGRMMAAGNSGARSGSAVVNFAGAVSSSIDSLGFGGNSIGNMAISSRVQATGMPKTREALLQFLTAKGETPRRYEDMSPSEKKNFDDALAEAQTGSVGTFAHVVAPLLQSDSGRNAYVGIMRDYVAKSGARKSLRPAMVAGALGARLGDTYTALAGGVGDPRLPYRARGAGLSWGEISGPMQESIIKAANKNNVDPATLASLLQYESNFQPGATSGTGARGLGQVTKRTFLGYQRQGLLQGYVYDDVSDPIKSADIAAQILAAKTREGGGNVREGLRRYHGLTVDKNGVGPDQEADAVLKNRAAYANNTYVLRAADANMAQASVEVGRQNAPLAAAVGEAPGRGVLVLDRSAATFSGAVERFVFAVSRMASDVHTPAAGAPVTPLGGRHWGNRGPAPVSTP